MKTYIALLRGINVGGHKKVSMSELKTLLKAAGFSPVKTYIQSGNIVCKYKDTSTNKVEQIIRQAIQTHFGFNVSIIVKTPKQLKTIFNACPFSILKKQSSYFTILHGLPDKKLVSALNKIKFDNEEFNVLNDCVYTFCASGYGKAKCNTNFFEKQLQTTATTRNYKTVLKLIEMSNTI